MSEGHGDKSNVGGGSLESQDPCPESLTRAMNSGSTVQLGDDVGGEALAVSACTPSVSFVPAYSPTQTEVFLTCPMLWWLREKQGWHVRAKWTPNRLIGQAVQAGLSGYYVGCSLQDCLEAANKVLLDGYEQQDVWTEAMLLGLVERGVTLGVNSAQLSGMEVVATEQPIYSRRPDVVLRMREGLVVDDNKVSLSLDARYLPSRLAEYDHSWQLLDYAYHVQQYYAEPVVSARIHLIILGPRRDAKIHPIPLSQERLSQWHRSAEQAWLLMHRMEQGLLQPWMNLRVCTDTRQHYGSRCELYEACHIYEGKEEQFGMLYDKEGEA